jgi:hypothetical protein
MDLIANDGPDLLLWKARGIRNIRFLEWFKFLGSGLEPLIFSFGVEIEATTVIVEGPQRGLGNGCSISRFSVCIALLNAFKRPSNSQELVGVDLEIAVFNIEPSWRPSSPSAGLFGSVDT